MSETLKSIYDAFATNLLGFIVGVILTWPFVYWYARNRYQAKLDAKEGVIEVQKERIAVAENKIGGALDEVNVKLEALERTNNLTMGPPWRSLTPDEKTRLESALQQISPKPRMQIMYANHLGAGLAKELGDVFVSAGWSLAIPVGLGSGLGLGISTGRGPTALLVTNAIESSTAFAVDTLPRIAQWPSDIVTLSIGINANEDGTAPRRAREQKP